MVAYESFDCITFLTEKRTLSHKKLKKVFILCSRNARVTRAGCLVIFVFYCNSVFMLCNRRHIGWHPSSAGLRYKILVAGHWLLVTDKLLWNVPYWSLLPMQNIKHWWATLREHRNLQNRLFVHKLARVFCFGSDLYFAVNFAIFNTEWSKLFVLDSCYRQWLIPVIHSTTKFNIQR